MLRHPLAILLLALLPLGLGGCLFDQPLTDPRNLTSPNIDTRLLGVFEFKEGVKSDLDAEKAPKTAKVQRAVVLPDGENRYLIYYRDLGKKPVRTLKFAGWISRVGSGYYLSIEDQTEGSSTFGKYGFFKFVWEFPGNFSLYTPDLKGFESAPSPYALRRALRDALKADTAFPYEATYWRKIARVWEPGRGEAGAGSEIPPEFDRGTTRESPGL